MQETSVYVGSLTKHTYFSRFHFGRARAVVKSLAGQLQSIFLPGDVVGHVRRGCHPSVVSLQTRSAHDSLVRGEDRIGLAASSAVEDGGNKKTHRFVLVNTDGKLAAVITDVVHSLR